MVVGKRSPSSTLYLAKIQDEAASVTIEYVAKCWLDPFAREKYNLSLKDTWVF